MKNILCGSKCVLWILNDLNKKNNNINKELFFITEIANELKNNNLDIELLCYNSNLYNDYKLNKLPIKEAVESIKEYEEYKTIKEVKLTEKTLLNELKDNYLILNVDSRIINNTSSNSGHYVVALLEDNNIKIINPEKTRYVEKIYQPKEIIDMCKTCGNWRIQIRRKYD